MHTIPATPVFMRMHRGFIVLFLGWRGARRGRSQNRKPVEGIENFLLMNHYERLATRYVFLKQDARVVGKKVKDLTEQRKRLNKEVRVLGRVLQEMRRYSISTFSSQT